MLDEIKKAKIISPQDRTKPHGVSGPIKINGGENPQMLREIINFPEGKKAKEAYFANRIFQTLQRFGFGFKEICQNEEDNLDFTLIHENGVKVLMDLAEVVIKNKRKENPYMSREEIIYINDIVLAITNVIKKKSDEYSKRNYNCPINLLFYVTHWRFNPSNNVLIEIANYLQSYKTIFKDIFFYVPFDFYDGILYFTMNNEFYMCDTAHIKIDKVYPVGNGKVYLILDPEKFEFHTTNG